MKILTKKKQKEIISLLFENAEITLCGNSKIDIDSLCEFDKNTIKLCEQIGDSVAALAYMSFIDERLDKERENSVK